MAQHFRLGHTGIYCICIELIDVRSRKYLSIFISIVLTWHVRVCDGCVCCKAFFFVFVDICGVKKVCRSRNGARIKHTSRRSPSPSHPNARTERNGSNNNAGLHKMRPYLSLELEMKFSIRKILQQQQQWRRATLTAHKFAIRHTR